MNRVFSSSSKRVLLKATQACVLAASLMCDQVFARSSSDLIEQLQNSVAKGKLEALESKEMRGCFNADDEYECSWTREEWERVLGVVIGLASDPHPRIRESVAIYMSDSTDARTQKPLGDMLMDPDARVRRVAVGSFVTNSVVGDPTHSSLTQAQNKIVLQLENLLGDTDPEIRALAASAVYMNSTRQTLQKLKKAHQREVDQHVRAVMAEIIQQMEKIGKRK